MHEIAQQIVSLFRKIGSELSTSQILEQIDKEYAELKKKLVYSRKEEENLIKRKIAEIHRRVLHHLNKLNYLGILTVTKHGEKGEKFFSLDIRDDEEIVEISPKYKKRIIVSKPATPAMPIEGYEQKGLVSKYETATWIDRLNSVVIFSNKINFEDLYFSLIENVFPVINDSINLENFEVYINNFDVSEFLNKINVECGDYGKVFCLTIYLSELHNKDNFYKILELLDKNRLENVRFIFSITIKEIEDKSEIISDIIRVFSKIKKDIYIKNKKLHSAPYFIGRAGPYSFIEKEWMLVEDLRDKVACLGCGQSSVIVDVNRFYNEFGLNINKFSELMFNISKSMFSANSIQRRKTNELFKSVAKLNKQHQSDFMILARNYIGIWNFGLQQQDINQEFVLNMINEAKKKINEFAAAEETIYKSCGMTTRFKLALSPAFETAGRLSSAKYEHLELKDYDDLLKKEFRKILSGREVISQIFDGGNEVTFHIVGNLDYNNLIKQIEILLSNYKIPLFNFNFSRVRGDVKLTEFLR